MRCLERRMNDKLSLNFSGTERQESGGGGGGGEGGARHRGYDGVRRREWVFNCQ